MAFSERELVTVVVDLARFTHAVAGRAATEIAIVIDRFYDEAGTIISAHGGRVVKYLGDGCLSVFPLDRAVNALDAVTALQAAVRELATELSVDLELGANVHLCTAAEGEFGPGRIYDIVGMGIVHTFRMGSGAGVRISEPVYRSLPSDRRSAWSKHRPPATYTLASG